MENTFQSGDGRNNTTSPSNTLGGQNDERELRTDLAGDLTEEAGELREEAAELQKQSDALEAQANDLNAKAEARENIADDLTEELEEGAPVEEIEEPADDDDDDAPVEVPVTDEVPPVLSTDEVLDNEEEEGVEA